MPMDGVTLSFLARELDDALAGGRIDKIAQPERDEVLLSVRAKGANHVLLLSASAGCARAHLTHVKKSNPLEPPNLCMLMRKHLLGGRIVSVRQALADRILEIRVEHLDELGDHAEKTIVCEFMGRHSNIIFINDQGRILDSARRVSEQMSSVREVLPGLRYERPPAHGKVPFDADEQEIAAALQDAGGPLHRALSEHVSGLSVQTAREIAFRATGDENAHTDALNMAEVAPACARILKETLLEMDARVLYAGDDSPVDVTAFAYRSRAALRFAQFPSLSAAMDEYYRSRDAAERIRQKSAALHRVLKNNLERCERKLALQQEALLGSGKMEQYRIFGELLTAHAHAIPRGAKVAEVPNYYAEGTPVLSVPLEERLSGMQNAQRYFKLYQKARSARTLAAEQAEKTRQELDYLEGQMDNLSKCEQEPELFELREELERYGYVRKNHNRRQMKKLPESQPMRFTSRSGIAILVGKNNLQNDKLTFSARPGEWWLHAKDMPGSHVIVVSENPDEETLFHAALLAAKYSRGANSSQVPVDYTQRRYVKKPSGAKPGFVIYTNQRTLYVTPEGV